MGSLSTVISITVVQGPIDCPAADGIPAILDGETAPFACPAYFRGWTILRCVTGVVGVFENHCAITDASFGLGVPSLRLRMGEAIPALSVVSSLPPMTFSISPALPDGLSEGKKHDAAVILDTMLCGVSDLREGFSDFINLEVTNL